MNTHQNPFYIPVAKYEKEGKFKFDFAWFLERK